MLVLLLHVAMIAGGPALWVVVACLITGDLPRLKGEAK